MKHEIPITIRIGECCLLGNTFNTISGVRVTLKCIAHMLKIGGIFQKVIVQFSIYDLALKPSVISENAGLRSLIFDKKNFSLVQKCLHSTDI